jgi:chromosome segregation protein
MYLKNIKLAGFKTFVDPVTVPLSAQRVAVVGPNGCGKSNIIDAVRWVLGESSAKYLRGESIVDVIFNGSSERKPVGQASIELLFDNTAGRIGGEYAAYQEISIRRQLSRDGQSNYYLNGTRCRRRDIIDIFLGTGLGPRNYAIIEQDTAHLVEAKPEVLRAAVEEAAGISKYKERRQETQRRIEDTRENLERLADLRQEMEKQLTHLQKQANAANRYTQLKEQERELRTQLFNLRASALNQQLNHYGEAVNALELQFDAAQAENTEFDTHLQALREKFHHLQEQVASKQTELHAVDLEVTRLTQLQQHQAERKTKLELDRTQAFTLLKEAEQQLLTDANFMEQLTKAHAEIQQLLLEANEKSTLAQQEEQALKVQLHAWQEQWDAFQTIASQAQREADVEQMRISQLESHLHTLLQQISHLEQESTVLEEQIGQEQNSFSTQLADFQEQITALEAEIAVLEASIQADQALKQNSESDIRVNEQLLQTLRESNASLTSLQKVALGQQNSACVEWLKEFGLSEKPRLAQLLTVTPGWERAIEVVLGSYLEAVCIEEAVNFLQNVNLPDASFSVLFMPSTSALSERPSPPTPLPKLVPAQAGMGEGRGVGGEGGEGRRSFVAASLAPLDDSVTAPFPLGDLLSGVYMADSLDEAWSVRHQLASHESIVTPEGIWLGPHWLRIQREPDEKMGVIARERELALLSAQQADVQATLGVAQASLTKVVDALSAQVHQKQQIEQQLAVIKHQQAEVRGQWQAQQAENARALKRFETVQQQLVGSKATFNSHEEAIAAAKTACQQAIDKIDEQLQQRQTFLEERDAYQTALTERHTQTQTLRQAAHEMALKVESLTAQMNATSQHADRLQKQIDAQKIRITSLETDIANTLPVENSEENLAMLEASRTSIKTHLTSLKQDLEAFHQQEMTWTARKATTEQSMNTLRDQRERERLAQKSCEARFAALSEQMRELGCEISLEPPSEVLDESLLEERLVKAQNRIVSLGAINLAAVEELEASQARKTYLDEQTHDLEQALDALENAIRQIDQETRQRFKETFDAINANFEKLFPRLFGGGQAKLSLVEQDWLTAGVQVMAQPPGKRNSTVHLLSGGEKALTAIALVFSLFELNPAPFCILDEIDAPLDDANVGRFCSLVKEMSERVQFIFVTHNKVAMEMAQHLIGVTMHEPGVSRLVAVNVDQAMEMVEGGQEQYVQA